MPNARHELILQIIQENNVTTQEMLRDLLMQNGHAVTQATISRDIRQLRLQKKRTANGVSCYVKSPAALSMQKNLLHDVVLKLDHAMNTVVVGCHAGSAQAACTVIDRMQLTEVVGTIAGDDTIFIMTRSEAAAEQLVNLLESQIWG